MTTYIKQSVINGQMVLEADALQLSLAETAIAVLVVVEKGFVEVGEVCVVLLCKNALQLGDQKVQIGLGVLEVSNSHSERRTSATGPASPNNISRARRFWTLMAAPKMPFRMLSNRSLETKSEKIK